MINRRVFIFIVILFSYNFWFDLQAMRNENEVSYAPPISLRAITLTTVVCKNIIKKGIENFNEYALLKHSFKRIKQEKFIKGKPSYHALVQYKALETFIQKNGLDVLKNLLLHQDNLQGFNVQQLRLLAIECIPFLIKDDLNLREDLNLIKIINKYFKDMKNNGFYKCMSKISYVPLSNVWNNDVLSTQKEIEEMSKYIKKDEVILTVLQRIQESLSKNKKQSHEV